ncbi:hypothetical protein QTP88_028673 [Uroleucon formosanum]
MNVRKNGMHRLREDGHKEANKSAGHSRALRMAWFFWVLGLRSERIRSACTVEHPLTMQSILFSDTTDGGDQCVHQRTFCKMTSSRMVSLSDNGINRKM